jgi:PAS fold.
MSRESDQSSVSAAGNDHLNRITDPVFAVDTSLTITYANSAVKTIFRSDELTGQHLADVVASGQENRLYIACQTASKQQESSHIQIRPQALVDHNVSSASVAEISDPDTDIVYHVRIFPSETGVTVYFSRCATPHLHLHLHLTVIQPREILHIRNYQ